MTTIHHATVKSAANKHGVTLSNDDEGNVVAAFGEREFTFPTEAEGDEPTQAELTEVAKDAICVVADVRAFEAEYPRFQIDQDEGDYVGRFVEDGEEVARDPELADLFETLREAGVEGADDEDDEPEVRSVVPYRYKREYAERGHPAHCGDWLAVTLNARCLREGGFVIEPMVAICEANGLDPQRWLKSSTRGWQGRFRMTSRNALAKVVAVAGVMHVPAEANNGEGDVELTPPAEWIAAHTPKARGKAAVEA